MVAVVGPRDADERLRSLAADVAAGLARAGCVVVTGGGGGVMAAANRGARAAGGTTLAFLPGHDTGADSVLDCVDIAVPTGLGEGRDLLVVRSAQVVVAVGGSWGTLAEVALARRAGTPVIGVAAWTVHDGDGRPVPGGVIPATDAADAVRRVSAVLDRPAGGGET